MKWFNKRKYKLKQSKNIPWINEIVQALLNALNDLESSYQFKGLNLESDLIKIYHNVKSMKPESFESTGFGPVSESDIADGLTLNKLKLQKSKHYKKKDIKTGHLFRIKTKVEQIRPDYRNLWGRISNNCNHYQLKKFIKYGEY